MAETRVKSLWRGCFNYAGEMHVLRCFAYSQEQAWFVLCRMLAKKKGIETRAVMSRFDRNWGQRQYSIELEIEYREVDECAAGS